MAASKLFDGKTLILVFQDGTNLQGEPKLVKKSIRNIIDSATEDQLFAVGNALAPLYALTSVEVCVDEDYVIVNEVI